MHSADGLAVPVRETGGVITEEPSRARVTAIRFAGAPMIGALDLRSAVLETFDARSHASDARRNAAIEAAVAAMFEAVSRHGKGERKLLIAAQRALRAGQITRADACRGIDAHVDACLATLRQIELLRGDEHARADAALREELDVLWRRVCDHPLLRTAIRANSPDLDEALQRQVAGAGDGTERLRRAVTGYATKLSTKANLLHVFGRLAIADLPATATPGLQEWLDADFYEFIAAPTQETTPGREAAATRWALAPIVTRDERECVMLCKRQGALTLVKLPASGVIDALLGCTTPGDRVVTMPRLREVFADAVDSAQSAVLDELVQSLCAVGVLTPIDRPACAPSALGGRAALAQHTARRDGGWVNSYAAFPANSQVSAGFTEALHAIRRVIVQDDTLADRRRQIRGWLSQALAQSGGSKPPTFVELLAPFLHAFPDVVAPRTASPDDVRAARWRAERSRIGGTLHGTLAPADLVAAFGLDGHRSESAEVRHPVVAIGPYSAASRRFFPQQFFYGDDRFLGRFLVGHRAVRRRTPRDGDAVCTEIAVAPPPELHRVLPTFDTGTGFDAACRGLFRTWIEPEDLVLAAHEGTVRWTRRSDGQPLWLQYRGTALSQYLPAYLQPLLIDQIDRYENPFAAVPGDGSGIEVVPELNVSGIVLRRQTWFAPVSVIREHWPDRLRTVADFLQARRCFRTVLECDATCWYVQTLSGTARHDSHKPRFLDLLSPDTVRSFAYALARAEPSALLSLTRMEPSREEVVRSMDGVVQEWMVES